MTDIFEKCYSWNHDKEVKALGVYPFFQPLEGYEGKEVIMDGRKVLMLGSNNYLGLTNHPKVIEAAKKAIDKYGTSCTGSRLINGTLNIHLELEERLAAFMKRPACLVFSTGMQSNLGAISALIGRGDVAITDKEDHASIVDGCRLGYGETKRFVHGDLDQLEGILKKLPDEAGRMVVVDGVFSMGGDVVDLPKLVPLCKKYGARLYVDDAHAVGVMGGGRGTAVHFGLEKEVDLTMGTFSKSFASLGGFVVGDEEVMNFIKHTARAFIFSASLPAPNVMAAMAALEIMESDPSYVERLWDNYRFMLKGLKEMGFNTGNSGAPIIPIIIGDDMACFQFWKNLYVAGLYCNPVIAPAVPKGMALLRTSYTAAHDKTILQKALDIFGTEGKKLGIIK